MVKGMSRYKFFWQVVKTVMPLHYRLYNLPEDRWIHRIIDVKRVNECIMCLKVLIGDKLVTCICAYVPQAGRSAEEKDYFRDQMISVS